MRDLALIALSFVIGIAASFGILFALQSFQDLKPSLAIHDDASWFDGDYAIGTIILAERRLQMPTNWLRCEGQEISTTQLQALHTRRIARNADGPTRLPSMNGLRIRSFAGERSSVQYYAMSLYPFGPSHDNGVGVDKELAFFVKIAD